MSVDEQTREVRVGETTYVLTRFRGLKATRIMREAAAIGRRMPKLAKQLAAARREYGIDNEVVMTRTEAEFQFGPDALKISEQAWEQNGGELRIRPPMALRDMAIAVFPDVMEFAEEHVIRLLALLSASNAELAEHYRDDDLDTFIGERGTTLLLEGDAEELLELAIAGVEIGRGQFAPLEKRLESLLHSFGVTTKTTPTEPSDSDSPETKPSEPSDSEETPPPSKAGSGYSKSSQTSPDSLSDSPPPTDGTPTPSSTESRGEPSLVSSTG